MLTLYAQHSPPQPPEPPHSSGLVTQSTSSCGASVSNDPVAMATADSIVSVAEKACCVDSVAWWRRGSGCAKVGVDEGELNWRCGGGWGVTAARHCTTRLHGCTAARLHCCTAAQLHGCTTAARLHDTARLHCTQHEPQPPWFLTGVVAFNALQSIDSGNAAPGGSAGNTTGGAWYGVSAAAAAAAAVEAEGRLYGGLYDGVYPLKRSISAEERSVNLLTPAVQRLASPAFAFWL